MKKIFSAILAAAICLAGCSNGGSDSSADKVEENLFSCGLLAVTEDKWLEDDYYGYINSSGEYVIEPQFDYAYAFDESNSLARVKTAEGKMGFIDTSGQWVIEPEFNYVNPFENGLALAQAENGGKWGYIDDTGSYVIEPKFEHASGFSANGLALVWESDESSPTGELNGYIDKSGEYAIEPRFIYAQSFAEDGLAVAIEELGNCGYIDESGEFVLTPHVNLAYDFVGDRALVFNYDNVMGEQYGYIDRSGDFIVEPTYNYASNFLDTGYAIVSPTGTEEYVIDKNGKTIGKAHNFIRLSDDNGYAAYRDETGGKWGFMDKKGDPVIEPQFDDTYYGFKNGRAFVYTQDYGWGVIDESGRYVSNERFANASYFYDDGYAIVTCFVDGSRKSGVIDKDGNFAVPLKYGEIWNFI